MHLAQFSGVIALAFSQLVIVGVRAADDAKLTDRQKANRAVERALQQERDGASKSQRAASLEKAMEIDKNHAPAHWQRGEVFEGGKWQTIEQASKKLVNHPYLRGYEKKRREAGDTEEGNWKLALWCEGHSMWLQKYAHLRRVLDLNPQNNAARLALGWRQTDFGWISPEQVLADVRTANDAAISKQKYGERIDGIVRRLRSANEKIVEQAKRELEELSNADAVLAIEQGMSTSNDAIALQAVGAISAIAHPGATRSLLRHAIYHNSSKVRERAGEELVKREAQGWAPSLLQLMRSEVDFDVRPQFAETGELVGLRSVFSQENRTTSDTLVVDTAYSQYVNTIVAGAVPRGMSTARLWDELGVNFTDLSPTDTVIFSALLAIENHNERVDQQFRIAEHARRTANSAVNSALSHNAAAKVINPRAFSVLDRFAKKKIGDNPVDYWEWWQEEKKWSGLGYRPKTVIHQKSEMVDFRKHRGFMPTPPTSCLVGATLVWLKQGAKPIKDVRIGDVVYCKDVQTGRIQLMPVHRLTQSKEPVELISFRAGEETIECSKGHEFFISGKGWMKACDMKAGDTLHGAEGPIKLESVAEAGKASVYNLVVANCSNYFVGDGKILSHDLTERVENHYLVPGLAPEANPSSP